MKCKTCNFNLERSALLQHTPAVCMQMMSKQLQLADQVILEQLRKTVRSPLAVKQEASAAPRSSGSDKAGKQMLASKNGVKRSAQRDQEEEKENQAPVLFTTKKIVGRAASKKVHLFVEIEGSETLKLFVDPERATVSDVAQQIRTKLGLDAVEPLYLTHDGRLLSLFSTLRSYGIKSGETIRLENFKRRPAMCHICPDSDRPQPFGAIAAKRKEKAASKYL